MVFDVSFLVASSAFPTLCLCPCHGGWSPGLLWKVPELTSYSPRETQSLCWTQEPFMARETPSVSCQVSGHSSNRVSKVTEPLEPERVGDKAQ